MDRQETINELQETRARLTTEIGALTSILEEKRDSLRRTEKFLTALKVEL